MRRFSLVVIVFVALATFPLAAEQPFRRDRQELGPRARIVRIIKSIFRIGTNSDGVTPPLPAAPPRP